MINAVGVWFYSTNTNRYFYLMRNDVKNPFTWGLPGGKVEYNESLHQAIERECIEELGFMPEIVKLVPIEKFTSSDNGFSYHTFFALVSNDFVPVLNEEHLGYCWIESGIWPKPLHPGLWSTVNFEEVLQKIETVRKNNL